MRFWIGITDSDWFEDLRRLRPDEVNFWKPSAQRRRAMDPGWPFLFKLYAPRNFIVESGHQTVTVWPQNVARIRP